MKQVNILRAGVSAAILGTLMMAGEARAGATESLEENEIYRTYCEYLQKENNAIMDPGASPVFQAESDQILKLKRISVEEAHIRVLLADAAIAQAKAALSIAESRKKQADMDMARIERLNDMNAISQSKLHQIKCEAALAAEKMKIAEAYLLVLEAQKTKTQTAELIARLHLEIEQRNHEDNAIPSQEDGIPVNLSLENDAEEWQNRINGPIEELYSMLARSEVNMARERIQVANATVVLAHAFVSVAILNKESADAYLKRLEPLVQSSVIPKEEYNTLMRETEVASNQVQKAKALLQIAEIQKQNAEIQLRKVQTMNGRPHRSNTSHL